ncbi:MAG: spore germination protein [Lachnospiraceae bacterium]|nr:spore germination protein [Lachnospiraceae bacterium]
MISNELEKNIREFKNRLPIEKSFDLIAREITIGAHKAYYILINGLIDSSLVLRLFQHFQGDEETKGVDSLESFLKIQLGNSEVTKERSFDKLITSILSGFTILVIDGFEEAMILDMREYPTRSPEEPDLEKVTRGARDGMVETLVFNTALVRRRIRDPKLVYEIKEVGTRSHTDVAVGYIQGVADPKLVQHITQTISTLDTEALVMGEKTLEELMIKKRWYNPFPQAKFTERPDVVSAHLLEGHVALFVDNSPSVMLFPATLFHFTQHSEDYYQNPLVGTFIRWIRFAAILISLFFTPTWLLIAENPSATPEWLQFLLPQVEVVFPLFIQLLLVELNLEILRMASIHTPSSLSTAMSIIGGLILGEYAIEINLLTPHTVFFMAISSLATYAVPSIEFGMGIRIYRMFILIMTGLFSLVGYIASIAILFLVLYTTKSFSGLRYTWPLIPFDGKALSNILVRKPIIEVKRQKKETQEKPVK